MACLPREFLKPSVELIYSIYPASVVTRFANFVNICLIDLFFFLALIGM